MAQMGVAPESSDKQSPSEVVISLGDIGEVETLHFLLRRIRKDSRRASQIASNIIGILGAQLNVMGIDLIIEEEVDETDEVNKESE